MLEKQKRESGREGGGRESGRDGCLSLLPTGLGAQAWGLVRALTCFRLTNTLSSSSSNSPPLLAAAVLLEQGRHLVTHLAPALLRLLQPAVTTRKIHTYRGRRRLLHIRFHQQSMFYKWAVLFFASLCASRPDESQVDCLCLVRLL
jgi:hypothetical protein